MGVIAQILSRVLEPSEREAVCGDLAEAGASATQAARDLSSLIARRQLGLWKQPRQWALFLFVVLPLTLLLFVLTQRISFSTAIDAWFYIDNWTPGYLAEGFRHDLVTGLGYLALSWLSLGCLAWISGFATGFMLRRAVWLAGPLVFLLLVTLTGLMVERIDHGGPNGPVFSTELYSSVLPFALLTALVLIPEWLGMGAGLRLGRRRVVCGCILMASLLSLRPVSAAPAKPSAPDFTLTDSTGRSIHLSAFKGKVVLLDFWATWCHGCKIEIPWYLEFNKRYRAQGLTVIGVATDDGGMKVVKPWLAAHGVDYTVVMGNETLANRYQLTAMPMTLLIDRQGRIAYSHSGVVDKKAFESQIRDLLH